MKKTPELIKKKRENKLEVLKKRAEISTAQNIQSMIAKMTKKSLEDIEVQKEKIIKRKISYIKKKEQEYKRKCTNEIRELQGKEQIPIKKKKKTRNQKLQLALSIAQENAKLRDTNKDGIGTCITCRQEKERFQLAGGHGITRQNQATCLRPENINAQCHTCNYIMGPMGSVTKKKALEERYIQEIKKKYGEDRTRELLDHAHKRYSDVKKYSPTEIFLDDYIPDLIEENERLRKTKSFYTPAKKRREYYQNNFIQ